MSRSTKMWINCFMKNDSVAILNHFVQFFGCSIGFYLSELNVYFHFALFLFEFFFCFTFLAHIINSDIIKFWMAFLFFVHLSLTSFFFFQFAFLKIHEMMSACTVFVVYVQRNGCNSLIYPQTPKPIIQS